MNWCTYCKFYKWGSICKKYDTFTEIARRTKCIQNSGFVRNQCDGLIYPIYLQQSHKFTRTQIKQIHANN